MSFKAETLLALISEIIACIPLEHEVFVEIGCYLYRTSQLIMELSTQHTPANTLGILQSLFTRIMEAKNLMDTLQRGNSSNSRTTVKQLQKVIQSVGECLSSIPSSTFQNQEYAQVVLQCLTKEMKHAQFEYSPKEEQNELSEQNESDLHSIHVGVSRNTSRAFNSPLSTEFLKNKSNKVPQITEYAEPLYEAFYCPLTKQIMGDPVTIESGVTYERDAITKWFQEFENSEEIFCPVRGQKLKSTSVRTNMALKTAVDEWIARNEAEKIKIARAALSLASSTTMVFEAIRDLQRICARNCNSKIEVCNAGVLPLLVKCLRYTDRDVRCTALELLHELTKENDDAKEIVVEMLDISTLIKMLSSGSELIRRASLLLMHELSTSQSFCQSTGSVPGGILMLIRIKYNRCIDTFFSEKAEEILKNLETYPENIKHMAENGFLEPLLNHLTQGTEEMQMEMASYLGEIELGNDSKSCVAEIASPALIQMVQSGNSLSRSSAFKALAKISSHPPNAEILTKAGITQIMAEEMFARRIYDEPMNSRHTASGILANIFEAGLNFENLQVNRHGHKITSDYVLTNVIDMLNNSTPDELNINLVRILLCLMKSNKAAETIASVIKQTEAKHTLIELINNPNDELGVAAIKLLIELSPHIGYLIVERLCKIRGQPENLIIGHTSSEITERQAVSVKFLAKLPQQNLTLNLALFKKNTVPKILQMIDQIQITGLRKNRYASACLEGLVCILVRFTATLYQPELLYLARSYNFTRIFTELLVKTSSDEVQRLTAIGLENLSSESINLSTPPQVSKSMSRRKSFAKFLSFSASSKRITLTCPVHRGVCSSRDTFCLIEADAIKSLSACLDHEKTEVVEAALAALCTLIDDRVDIDKSVCLLTEENTVERVLNVIKEHEDEGLRQKAFWVIERFLMKGGDKSASCILQDRSLPVTLISAFHNGNGNTRHMAEKILRLLNRMPKIHFSVYDS